MITIVPYNPAWPAEFTKIGRELRLALGNLALRIDHIGSTSVPHLDAKDIIDVQITVPSFDHFDSFRTIMETVGCTEYVGCHRSPATRRNRPRF